MSIERVASILKVPAPVIWATNGHSTLRIQPITWGSAFRNESAFWSAVALADVMTNEGAPDFSNAATSIWRLLICLSFVIIAQPFLPTTGSHSSSAAVESNFWSLWISTIKPAARSLPGKS
jgi:hypothetical protein